MNVRNFGIAQGRLTRDPQIFTNKDGSRKVMFTLAARDNFKGSDGKRGTQFINLEAFISNKQASNGVYGYMHKGDFVTAHYTVRSGRYVPKGSTEEVFTQTLLVQEIDLGDNNKRSDGATSGEAEPEAPAMPEEAPAPAEAPKAKTGKGRKAGKAAKANPEDQPFGA